MPVELLRIEEPARSARPAPSFAATFELGFRPLYALGMAWAGLVVAIWVFAPSAAQAPLAGVLWHAHEMLWGFVATIAVGFLLTAVPNWTGRPTLRGWPLAALCLAWLLARAGLLAGGPWFRPAAVLDVTFFAAAALACARPILQTRNRRNLGVPLLLLGLGATDAAFLWAAQSAAFPELWRALHAGLLLMAVVAALIGRRVIPFFATRAVPGLPLNAAAGSGVVNLALLVLAAGLQMLGRWPVAEGLALLGAAGIMLTQLLRWKPWRVLHQPLLWILDLGYAGLAGGLTARGAQALGAPVPDSLWIHLLAVCGFAVLILGMVTRTSLGHLGRALRLDRWSLLSYGLLLAAAVLRLLAFVPWPAQVAALQASAVLWALACWVFVLRYLPWLVRPRADRPPAAGIGGKRGPARG